MIIEKSREDLGFSDDLGYMYFSDDDLPVLQLHSYYNGVDYNTIFWRGATTIEAVFEHFHMISREITSALNINPEEVRKFTAHYGLLDGIRSFPLVLKAETSEEHADRRQHSLFFDKHSSSVTFVRLENSYSIPIILWADLSQTRDSEIGFSSVVLLDHVIEYFQKTSFIKLNQRDMDRLQELLHQHMMIQPAFG